MITFALVAQDGLIAEAPPGVRKQTLADGQARAAQEAANLCPFGIPDISLGIDRP